MTTLRFGRGLAAAAVGLAAGCVDRRFVVDTNVPGAQITVDGKPIGPSPADGWYTYTGNREFRAVAPGYQPLTKVVKFTPKWYDYPGLDFFAEVLWPFRIEDVRRVRLDLQPAQQPRTDELLDRANWLRDRGLNLPPASVPDDPPGAPPGREVSPPRVVTPGPQMQTVSGPPGTRPAGVVPSGPGGAGLVPGPASPADPSALFPPPPPGPQSGPGVVPEIGTYNR